MLSMRFDRIQDVFAGSKWFLNRVWRILRGFNAFLEVSMHLKSFSKKFQRASVY